MSVDWVTVIAQVVNFLILVYLLKRFLYQRVIDAMDRRERRIAEDLDEARHKAEEARSEIESYRRKSREIDERREEILSEATAEADRLRNERREALRKEVEATRRNWFEQVERERATFVAAVRRQVARHFVDLARRALGDIANADLETQVVQAFLERLRGADGKAVAEVAEACREGGEPLRVASGFELSPELKRRMTRAVREQIDAELEVSYEVSAEITCGLEISGGGRSIVWSLDGYLDSFETRLETALEHSAPVGARLGEASVTHA